MESCSIGGVGFARRCTERRLAAHVRQHLEQDGDKVADLHLWRLGPGHMGAIVSIVSDHPKSLRFTRLD